MQIGNVTIDLVDEGLSADRRIIKLRASCGGILLEKSLTVNLDSADVPGDAIEAEIEALAAQLERVCYQNDLVDPYILAFKSR